MNKKSIIAILLCTMLLASCSNLSTPLFSTATPMLTLTSITPTETPVPTKKPTSTITPIPTVTIEAYSKYFPVDWKLEPLSVEQVNEVNSCDIEKLASERYPEKIIGDESTYMLDEDLSSLKGRGR